MASTQEDVDYVLSTALAASQQTCKSALSLHEILAAYEKLIKGLGPEDKPG